VGHRTHVSRSVIDQMKLELSVAQVDRHGNLNCGSGTRL